MYCVYEHWRPDVDLCFYVGAGKGPRATNMRPGARSERHLRIQATLADLGMCVEVRMVKGGLTREQAYALEAKRIALWRGMGVDLVNMTNGGGGAPGLQHSAESRARRSAAMKGNRRLADAPRTEEWRANISKALTGRRGAKQSEETKRKRAEALRGKKRTPEQRKLMSDKAKLREQKKREARDAASASSSL